MDTSLPTVTIPPTIDRFRLGLILLAAALVMQAGCTWVSATEDSRKVAIVPAARTQDCRMVGTATTSVKSSIAGIARNREKVLSELDTLARLEAVNIGANTLVRVSAAAGSATYRAFICP